MTRDEFDLWLINPVTKWVFAGIERAREQEKAEWIRRSWDSAPHHAGNGEGLLLALLELKTRADALGELVDNKYENWSEWNGEQPERD